MHKVGLALMLGALAATGTRAQTAQREMLPVERDASVLRWTGHAEVGSYSPMGTLRLKEGALTFAGGQFRGADLSVDMNSLQQENADLTHHLKSADFFDVERFPTAVIHIERVAAGMASGTITIRGKATPFQTPVKVKQMAERFEITGKVELDRTKYGITFNSKSFFSGLGDKAIRNQFEVEFDVVGRGVIPPAYR